jgi:hypothetical protein
VSPGTALILRPEVAKPTLGQRTANAFAAAKEKVTYNVGRLIIWLRGL